MASIIELEKKIVSIEKRNARVEADKEWETSLARRALLASFTYISVSAYFAAISIPDPFLNAVVPTAAFLLSTLTLPFFREIWLKSRR